MSRSFNVLLVMQETESRNRVAFILESQLNVKVVEAADFQGAVDRLLEDEAVDLLICERGAGLVKLSKYLLSSGAKVPLVILSENLAEAGFEFPEIEVLATVSIKQTHDELLRVIRERVQLAPPAADEKYMRIRANLIMRVVPLRGDIFIRLSSVKYIKLFRKGDALDQDFLKQSLERKGIDYLYLRIEDAPEFVDKFSADLASFSEQIAAGPPGSALDANASVHALVHELVQHMGLTPAVQQMANQQVNMAIKAMGNNPKLNEFIKNVTSKEQYISTHSVVTANVSNCLALQMDWPSDSTCRKLSLAAFFHDITLDNQELAEIDTLQELSLKKDKFTKEQIAAFNTHAIKGAELVRTFKEIPSDVDIIISQHHERPDGSGFPRGLTATNIAPLASVFIIAHDLANQSVGQKDQFNVQEFIEMRREIYNRGTFKKVWQKLDTELADS